MSRWDEGWGWQDFGPPRPVADGVQARSTRFGESWWAKQWIGILESFGMESRLTRGRSYARRGQVVSMHWQPGGVKAKVQGSQPWPYSVEIAIAPLPDQVWEKAFDLLADQARYAAALLAGEMPEDIESAFTAVGASLFPGKKRDLETDCTCPDWGDPCKHVAAVFYLMGDQFDADPFRLFLLRGRARDAVMEALRARRGVWAEGRRAVRDPLTPQAPTAPPLDSLLDSYYAGSLDGVGPVIAPPPVEAPVLQRLGPAPAGVDAALRAVLRQASRWAIDRVRG